MFVNKEKLEKLIDKATVYCEDCPIYEVGDWTACDKYRQKDDKDFYSKSCEEAILDWLQEFDIAEALEEGAHIVNDQVVFPPEVIPDKPDYGVPCEKDGQCNTSCPYHWTEWCPYE